MGENLSDDEIGECCLVVVGNKIDLARCFKVSVVPEGTALDVVDELILLSGSPAILVTLEDERDWIPPTQGPNCVSSGSEVGP